jgi:pilus assembly protein CpaC
MGDEGEELKMYIGEMTTIPVSNPTRVAIGNPSIADIVNVTRTEITITPKAAGKTTLTLLDNFGEQSYLIKVFTEDIIEVKRRIDNLLGKLNFPEVRTQAEEEEGKVFLLGRVKTSQDREKIATTLGELRNKTMDLIEVKEEEAVIEIDAQVLELNKDASNTLGFTWPGSITITEQASPGIATSAVSQVGSTTSTTGGTAVGTKWSNLFKVLNFSRSQFSWTLDALVQEGKAKILSKPRLACQSGKEAELLVGGEKPVFTTQVASAGGEGTSVEYKEYGIKLKIKPTVNDERRIKLGLNIEISEIGTAETIGSSSSTTAKAYPLTKRNISTEVFLDNGQTLAIGGLIKEKAEEDIRKTPWLGDIPIIGAAFRKKSTKSGGGQGERGNTELFITLTPNIIADGRGAVRARETEKEKEIISPRSRQESRSFSVAGTADTPDSVMEYAQLIQKRILENIIYPKVAKESGFQGIVKLGLHLSYSGELVEALVKESSGYAVLDDQAVAAAKRIASYPPFPSSINEQSLWIDVPIIYRLD